MWAWEQDKPVRGDIATYKEALRWDPCAYCLKRVPVFGNARDHIDPKSRGGANDWTNLTSACSECNSRKGVFTLLGFLGRAAAVSHYKEQLQRWRMQAESA